MRNVEIMDSQEAIAHLESKGVRPTANRIIVLRTLCKEHRPMTLSAMESVLLSMDKSSIFRVLSLFLEHDVVHAFEDGRGMLNYELCEHHGQCSHTENHVHFYCESCKRSFCLEDIHIPEINLPDDFLPHSVSFVIKGECPNCRKNKG